MRINVKLLQGPDCYPTVTEETSVHELKKLIAHEMDIPVDQQRLMFKGKAMKDDMTLQQYGVTQSSKVFLSIKDQTGSQSNIMLPKNTLLKSSTSITSLQTELEKVLLKHFLVADAKRISDEFHKDFQNHLQHLSLDDIEHIAEVNLLQKH
jgi:hypothetical protein